jgi:seryl-tRNA synthetase
LTGTGFNPRGDEKQIYNIEDEGMSLVGTAEITLGGYFADEILNKEDLPIKFIGLSHCFRVEKGGYGKYSKGLYRVRQFTKVEMFIICHPDESEKYHQELLNNEKEIWNELDIPYRVMMQCTGDMGSSSMKTYDVEAWMPGRGDYGEVTSTSNTGDYQARRLKIRFKDKDGENKFVHMLNGTAVNNSRFPLTILENGQEADGSVKIPEVLHKYTGFTEIRR